LTEAERTRRSSGAAARKPSVVEAIVRRFCVDECALDDQAGAVLLDIAKRLQDSPALVGAPPPREPAVTSRGALHLGLQASGWFFRFDRFLPL
jgi:hypothetical protein